MAPAVVSVAIDTWLGLSRQRRRHVVVETVEFRRVVSLGQLRSGNKPRELRVTYVSSAATVTSPVDITTLIGRGYGTSLSLKSMITQKMLIGYIVPTTRFSIISVNTSPDKYNRQLRPTACVTWQRKVSASAQCPTHTTLQ